MIEPLREHANKLAVLVGVLLTWDLAWAAMPSSQTWLVALLGVPVVVFLPGALTCVCLGARRMSALVGVFSIGFSLLTLYLVGLAGNFLPQLLGNDRPLDTPVIWALFNLTFLALCAGAAIALSEPEPAPVGSPVKRKVPLPPRGDGPWWVAPVICAVAVMVPILAVLGAVTLNNGGGSALAVRALLLAVVVGPATYLLRYRVGDVTLLTVIATLTLGLLLATSARSWYISGQDMQHEFQVFSLATVQGRWDVAKGDPYNACLSVTLLPVSLSELLRIDGQLIFKVLDQALFVTVPLTLFSFGRRFLGRGCGFIVALLFIGLPTFSLDVPYITRQEIAFIFVALAVAAVFVRTEGWVRRRRSLIFVCMSAGVVFSHYSTAYLFVASLLISFVLSRVIKYAVSGRHALDGDGDGRDQLSMISIVGVTLMAIVWFGPVTHAGGDLVSKVGSSSSSVMQVVSQPLLVFQALGQPNAGGDELTDYASSTTVGDQAAAPTIARALKPVDGNAPESGLIRSISGHTGLNLAALMSVFYYALGTKVYLLGCTVGTLLLFAPRIRSRFGPMPVLYPIWCLSVAAVLGMQLLLPGLAESYGITRAFMQVFIVMCVPMVVLFRVMFAWWRPAANGVLVGLSTGLLLVYSGLGPYLTGGLHPQLSLENGGPYYGTVYPHDTDIAAASWVGRELPAGAKVNTADFAAAYAYHPTYTYDFTSAGLFPFQVKSGSYVMLSTVQTQDHLVYRFDTLEALAYDPAMYDSSDLVYNSGPVQIIRKR